MCESLGHGPSVTMRSHLDCITWSLQSHGCVYGLNVELKSSYVLNLYSWPFCCRCTFCQSFDHADADFQRDDFTSQVLRLLLEYWSGLYATSACTSSET